MTHSDQMLQTVAEAYVRCALGVGLHDADYVDAYHGPPSWNDEVAHEHPVLDELQRRARSLIAELEATPSVESEGILLQRHRYLLTQLRAMAARIDFLLGRRLPFDQESRLVYDAVAPAHETEHFDATLTELSALLPGPGSVQSRYERFRSAFMIPADRVDRVFRAAIEEARRRTRTRIGLPEEESFQLEYVTGKSWSGYNWYKGESHSLIQINTDFPISIDRAVDLASHEGYPGHHVYNTLMEQTLLRARGWMEFSVYALFSPQSLVAEGTANFGIAMAFPGPERVTFEREVLFPAAGLDPAQAEHYYRVHDIVQKLSYAGNEAARRYLDGSMTRDEAAGWLERYALMSPERAQQRTRFFDQYRSYVINYNLGQDIVGRYIELKSGADPEKRWQVFTTLLTTPQVPSALVA